MWGIITVQMLNLGFPFTQAELFTLTAIAGIAGATMRIPASFLIRLAGGRNTIFLTTAMLLAPAIGTGIVLQHKDWPLWAFQLMALWSGVGGGNFASSMSNISTFFPKRLQGTALGINAGIGNFGVTTMQIVIPLVMTLGIFGALGGSPMTLVTPWLTTSGRSRAVGDNQSMRELDVAITRLPGTADLPLPSYQTAHSAAMDLAAAVVEPAGGVAPTPTEDADHRTERHRARGAS